MESRTVDARGLACPQPVIETRKALRDADDLTVIVDNDVAQKNVSRMAEKLGHSVQTDLRGDGIYVHIRGEGAAPAEAPALVVGRADPAEGPLVLVVPSEYMGRGEHDELGHILVRAFFHTLGEVEPLPRTIVFFNSGAKLVAQGSPVLEDLEALAEQGIDILACGTCLEYYGLKDKLAVGEISNMYTIAETMLGAGRVVKL